MLLVFTTSIHCQFNKAGRTSLQFLKIGMGARAVGMGEACIASLNDINGIYWNPATITGIKNIDVSFSYTQWIADLNIMGGAVGINLNEWGVFALSYISLDYGEIPEAYVTSISGSVDTRTGEFFSGGDLSIGLTYAKKFTDKLSIGIQIKYLNEDLYSYSSDVIAFDVGSYYDTGWKGIRLAMSAQNLAGNVRWLSTKEEAQHQGLMTVTGEFYPEMEEAVKEISSSLYQISLMK